MNSRFSTGTKSQPYDLVLPKTKEVEALLRSLGYTGRGVHELVSSAGEALDHDVVRAARKVCTIRNKLVHEVEFSMSAADIEGFRESANFVIYELGLMVARRDARLRGASRSTGGGFSLFRFAGAVISALRG